MRVVLLTLTLVLVCGIAVVSADRDSTSERKKRFKQGCSAAIENEPDLDAADVNEYTEYVSAYGKLDRYLNDGCDFTRNYRAYESNKRRIDELNANANRFEVVNGRVFNESYGVNEFTDCDDDCRRELLVPFNPDPNRRRLQRGGNRGGNRRESEDCIELDQDYFADVDAAATIQDSMWRKECGAVKNQGGLGTCWAFSATAQLQCNFNAAHQETRVFSEKYATDCSGSSEGRVVEGGDMNALNEWYTDNGACSDYYKAYNDRDSTDYNGDCDCDAEKEYGQCYKFFTSVDAKGKLAIANAAQLYALSFGVAICSSFYDVGGDNAVWYGCKSGEALIGGHAMTIVGQDGGRYVLVRNSWGTDYYAGWGSQSEPGHVWFHSDVWSSQAGEGGSWMEFSFTYFPPQSQSQSEHEVPIAKCHAQGPCDSGFMDTSDGSYTRATDNCAADCAGGDYVDDACNCVCQAVGICDDQDGDEDEPLSGEDEVCPLVSSDFKHSSFNGDWTYVGQHNEKAYYQRAEFFVAYSGGQYIITDDLRSGEPYCNCGATELSQCAWYCWDGAHAKATALANCDSSCVCEPNGEEGGEEGAVNTVELCEPPSGDWTDMGFELYGKPFYKLSEPFYGKEFFVAYTDGQGEYMIQSVDVSKESKRYDATEQTYCKCGATELSECAWDCSGIVDALAVTLTSTDCGSSPGSGSRTRTRSARSVNDHNIKLVEPITRSNGPALIAITTDEALAVAAALLICVNVCVAMEIMRRRTGMCRKTSYAKVQMVEDSEDVMQSEAEQILQVSN